jgi:hypothetical protein
MECIICQDTGLEKLQDNTSCSCKYKCHPSCWIDYVHSKNQITCPLCRKIISVKPTVQTQQVQPTAPPYALSNQPQEIGQQISYQEFVDIIRQYNAEPHTVIEIRPQQQTMQQPIPNRTASQKLLRVIVGLAFVVLIIVILSVILR